MKVLVNILSKLFVLFFFVFFFQAEDGIRDGTVTGVQTCALPISHVADQLREPHRADCSRPVTGRLAGWSRPHRRRGMRSEEHTSELQSQFHLVCRLLLEIKKKKRNTNP